MSKKDSDQFPAAEARRRFEAALRGGLSTPPKPLKNMTPKRAKPQQRKSRKAR